MATRNANAPAVEWLDDTLCMLHESTNVGVIRADEQALLIDCGSGAVLERLPALGITTVAWVLATHFHRDSCSGLPHCREQGARLAVPAAERDLFDTVERHWTAPTSLFHRYRLRIGTNVLARSVAVDRALADGDVFPWGQRDIRVVSTPGHTDGSVSYVVDGGNERIAFVGDLLYAGGRFWELWSLQGPLPDDPVGSQDYHAFCGRGRQAVQSIERLLERLRPDLLVNMHVVPPFVLPATFLAEARAALRERARLLERLVPWEHPNFGLDPQWVRAYPFRQKLAAGAKGALTLQFSNYAASTLHVDGVLTVPAGWTVQQPTAGQVAPGTDGALVAGFVVPPDTATGRYILTADVSVDGRALGSWIAALVDIGDT